MAEPLSPLTPTEATPLVNLKQQKMADRQIEKFNRNCGGGHDGWCQYVVADEQLEDFPAATLLCARVCRLLLLFFIIFCVLGLISGWLFEGDMTLMEEVITKNEMPLPNVAICPQPWGSTFTGNLMGVESAEMIQVPGGKNVGKAKYTETTCPPSEGRLLYCSCVDLSENVIEPHGKRGELAYFDYIKLRLSAENDSPAFQFALGFYAGDVSPQQWSYVTEGHIVEGDVKMEEVATGKTEFSDGESVARFNFRVTGDAPAEDGMTTLVFGYDKYLSFVISSFASKWSFFAMMTLLITFCAAINNFQLFELTFPEKSETSALEPAPCFRFMCFCFVCCHPKDEGESEDVDAQRRSSEEFSDAKRKSMRHHFDHEAKLQEERARSSRGGSGNTPR